jgi:hypothetical protein
VEADASNEQIDLSVIKVEASFSAAPGEAAKAEEDDYKQARRRLEISSITQDLVERKKYANLIFVLAVVWLAVVLWIIILQGFGGVPGCRRQAFSIV